MLETFSIISNSRALFQWIALGRSFMYRLNRRGFRILPWGIPDMRIVDGHKLKSVYQIIFELEP